jgi:hypothetical protein
VDVTRYSESDEGTEEEGLTAHGYLRKVYQDPLEPTHVRMRAAQIAIEFELPKLKAAAILYSGTFAASLERAIERSEPAIIEARAEPSD